jgi:hypothetical protein
VLFGYVVLESLRFRKAQQAAPADAEPVEKPD